MIDKTAIIYPGAEIEGGVEIGPYSIIGSQVRIGQGTKIGPHVVIQGRTQIGQNNQIYQFCSLGEAPQILNFQGNDGRLVIGDENIIREGVTINLGGKDEARLTHLGHRNFMMAYSHIAHDCWVGDNVIFANEVALAGHVKVEDFVFIGGAVVVSQFCRIGTQSFIGGFSGIARDIPPYVIVRGEGRYPDVVGINIIGLQRRSFSPEIILNLKRAFKDLFYSKKSLADSLLILKKKYATVAQVMNLVNFIESSKVGIATPLRRKKE